MAVGIPDGETPKGIINHFSEALCIPENQKYGPFTAKMPLNKRLLTSIKDITMLN